MFVISCCVIAPLTKLVNQNCPSLCMVISFPLTRHSVCHVVAAVVLSVSNDCVTASCVCALLWWALRVLFQSPRTMHALWLLCSCLVLGAIVDVDGPLALDCLAVVLAFVLALGAGVDEQRPLVLVLVTRVLASNVCTLTMFLAHHTPTAVLSQWW